MDFTTHKLDYEQLLNQYNSSPKYLLICAPLMLLFVFLEYRYTQSKNIKAYEKKDFWASIGIGSGYLIATSLTSLLTIKLVWATYYYLCPPALLLPKTWWSFLLCFVVYDLLRYWAHRIAHEQRIWWASHVTHHSSEYFNLTVSFRLCWVDQVKIIFFLPVIVLGFDPIHFFIAHQVAVLYQFWQHTETIKELPAWVEWFFVTPSSHRVHHGKNECFIDKNYGSTFIIWDRLFGTYAALSERPVYGITEPVNSYNPAYLVFHEYIDIIKDVYAAKTWKDKWTAVFGRPGAYKRSIAESVELPVEIEKQTTGTLVGDLK
jgi:sterol desaturase/sphingolipid hydroxylase (fatty acid hydroxylase superfamily)